jgi:hypothetical protein
MRYLVTLQASIYAELIDVAPAWRRVDTHELDEYDDEDQMDDMIIDIGMQYDLGHGDQHPPWDVQNFYKFLAASD